MAIRALTDSTGKRMAAAMENLAGVDSAAAVKIPHIDNFDFKTIANYAKEYGHSEKREFAFLICHSMLPLLGYDHMVDTERLLMEAHQEAIMNEINIVREAGG